MMTPQDAAKRPSGREVVLGPGAGRQVSLGPAGVVTLKAVAGDSAGTLSAYECTLPPATAGLPLHLHRTRDEAFYVLEGEMTFLIDGTDHRAPAGSFGFVPSGILHIFWNASDQPTTQLTVSTPSGIEDYFDAVTQVLASGAAPTI